MVVSLLSTNNNDWLFWCFFLLSAVSQPHYGAIDNISISNFRWNLKKSPSSQFKQHDNQPNRLALELSVLTVLKSRSVADGFWRIDAIFFIRGEPTLQRLKRDKNDKKLKTVSRTQIWYIQRKKGFFVTQRTIIIQISLHLSASFYSHILLGNVRASGPRSKY